MATILLADDDATTRDLAERALRQDGHRIEIAHDGSEALRKLSAAKPAFEVLVSDVQMPGIDGIELVRRVAAEHPRLRVLLMSGFTDQLDRAKGLKVARLMVLSKPFALEKLRSTVRDLLR